MIEYYVYCLLDPTKKIDKTFGDITFEYEPFYIGKGSKNRIKQHFSDAQLKRDKNKSKVNKILKIRESGHEPIKYKIYENLTEIDALEKEKELIFLIGRKDLKTGYLTNLTFGGENNICKFEDLNINTQNRLKEQRRIKMLKNNPMKNKETSKKVSDFRKNITHDDTYKKNMSASLKNSEKHKKSTSTAEFKEKKRKEQEKNMIAVNQFDINGIFIEKFSSISEASKRLKITKEDIRRVLNGRRKTAKKFIFEKC